MHEQMPNTVATEYLLDSEKFGGDVTITVNGVLQGEEIISIVTPGTNGAGEANVYLEDEIINIRPTNSIVRLQGKTKVKIKKPITVNPVGFIVA